MERGEGGKAAGVTESSAGLPRMEVESSTVVDRIAQAVRESIMRGDLVPGTPLREMELTKALGVSRNSVREALRLLVQEGLVDHGAYRTPRVTELADQDISDIFAVRRAIELTGVDAAADAAPDQIAALREACDAYQAATEEEDWPTAFESDVRLHMVLGSLLGSERINRFLGGVLRELRLAYFMLGGFETEGLPRDRRQHSEITRLIEHGEHGPARKVLEQHLADSEELLRRLMRDRLGEGTGTPTEDADDSGAGASA